MKVQTKFLAVLPWLRITEEIKVGPATFWRWPEDAKKYIHADSEIEDVRKSINSSFCNVSHSISPKKKGWKVEPLETITLVNLKKDDPFMKDNPNDLQQLFDSVNVLCACALFDFFIPKEMQITEEIQGIQSRYRNYTDFNVFLINPFNEGKGFFRIRRKQGYGLYSGIVTKPMECSSEKDVVGLCTLADKPTRDVFLGLGGHLPLLRDLGKLLESEPSNFRSRVLRSLEFFNRAYTDSYLVSPLMEIVMLATAFEILLDIRRGKKADELGRKLKELFSVNETIKEPSSNESWKVHWIKNKFYRLRNDIVHGKGVDTTRLIYDPQRDLRYVKVAIPVFRLTLLKLLAKEGFHAKRDYDWEMNRADTLDSFLERKD